MGWGGVKNGALLVLASKEFDAFLAVDKNLPHVSQSEAEQIFLISRFWCWPTKVIARRKRVTTPWV